MWVWRRYATSEIIASHAKPNLDLPCWYRAITNNASHQRHESALKVLVLLASSSYAMDDFAVELLAARHDESPERPREPKAPSELDPSTASPQRSGLRSGLAALREKANIQDRLVEKSV